jgi:G:T-mismatch repair DNA endonuclease (very short patch repair protein)
MIIDPEQWLKCKICQKSKKEICQSYGGRGIYYSKSFIKHLSIEHSISVEEYFVSYCKLSRPKCQCGICNKDCQISIKGSRIQWKSYMCGRNPGILEWSNKAKIDRQGSNNPMFGKTAWNKNKSKENSEQLKRISEQRKGIQFSDETKLRMSQSAKKRTIHGHTGFKHSEESKQKNRDATLQRIKNGDFKQTKTKPHLELEKVLVELGLKFESEKILHHWSFDVYLIDFDVYIEVDGDYFHSNPKIYPNGPKTKTQKINHSRDTSKNKYCTTNHIKLIRFWECDILNDIEKVKLELCKLKK